MPHLSWRLSCLAHLPPAPVPANPPRTIQTGPSAVFLRFFLFSCFHEEHLFGPYSGFSFSPRFVTQLSICSWVRMFPKKGPPPISVFFASLFWHYMTSPRTVDIQVGTRLMRSKAAPPCVHTHSRKRIFRAWRLLSFCVFLLRVVPSLFQSAE